MPPRDPDDVLVVLFRHEPMQNDGKTLTEGRPIYDDVEVCEIRAPGSRDVKIFPATEFSRWTQDPLSGHQRKESYAERFRHQYRQFKERSVQTKTGTPLEHLPFLSDGRRAELRALNIYTAESLAAIEGQELKNIGMGGRDLKNKAAEFIEESRSAAPNKQMMAELEVLKARNAILEEDAAVLKRATAISEGEFEGMSLEQLKGFVTSHTGIAPQGSLSRKTLVRLATDANQGKT